MPLILLFITIRPMIGNLVRKRRPRLIVFLIALWALTGTGLKTYAQNLQIIDSLVQALSRAKDDTNKTKLFYRIWQQYRNNDVYQAEHYARRGLAHAQKIKWDKGVAAFYTSVGEGFSNERKDDSAVFYYSRAIDIYRRIGFAKGLAGAYNNMSTVYENKSDYVQAIEYGFKALNIVLDAKDTSYAILICNNIGKYYFDQKDYTKALEYTLKAFKMSERTGAVEGLGHSYSMLATIYAAKQDTVQSIYYYNRALRIFETSQDLIQQAETYANLAVLKKTYPENLEYAFTAKRLFDSLQLSNHIIAVTNLGNIGLNYFDLVRFKDNISAPRGGTIPPTEKDILALAEVYLNNAIRLSRETHNAETLLHFLRALGELEEYRNNPAKALAYYKESYALSDTLYSQENKNKIASLESQRAIDQRDKQLAINKLELSNARRTRIALIGGAGLLLVIGGLLFYQNRIRLKTNSALLLLNSDLDKANQIKTRFFGILSHDLRSPVVNLIHFLHLQKEAPDLLDEERSKLQQLQLAESAENLLETMEAILLWSKSQMERFAPQKKTLAVSELFDYIRKNIPANPAITISFYNPEDTMVYTDADYLKTIMYNLTANAMKATQNTDDARLEWSVAKEGGKVIISITDNGPGIVQEQMDALYNKEALIGTKYGLGLHIIRDLAEAIACKIVLDVGDHGGTKFTLLL